MFFKIVQIAVPFIWFGCVAAISFMEAPLKFSAPNITLELGLGIGYLVFHALNKIELGLLIIFFSTLFFERPNGRTPYISFAVIGTVLLLQTFWLFPLLDMRTAQVINGTAEPYSNLHVIYIVLDSIKVISLLALGISLTRQNLRLVDQSNVSR